MLFATPLVYAVNSVLQERKLSSSCLSCKLLKVMLNVSASVSLTRNYEKSLYPFQFDRLIMQAVQNTKQGLFHSKKIMTSPENF